MVELKWTDKDMIDFANSCSEYDIDVYHLSDFAKGRKQEAIQRRINIIVEMATIDETLLEKLEKVLNEGTK